MLVGAVLLQPGKTDAGALFTSNVNSNSFGPRGTATVLSKITIVAAVVFMVTALMIAMPAFNGGSSVLNATTAETPAEAPADSNANISQTANVSSVPTADNSNGALVQTPATDQFSNQAANQAETNTSASASANVGNSNASAPANKPNK